MRRSVVLLTSAAAAAFLAAACSSSSTNPSGPGTGTAPPVVISNKVTVALASAVNDVVVAQDRLTFPAASHQDMLARKAGDILVGDPKLGSTTNPRGFLRKVKSVATSTDGMTIVVLTDPALLNEAVQQGSFRGTLQAPALGLKGPVVQSARLGGLRPETNGPMLDAPMTLLDFSGKDIFRGSGSVNLLENPPKSIGFDAHATFQKATLTFTPKFDVGADIRLDLSNILGSVHEFHAIATGQLDADVEIEMALDLTGNATGADLTQLIAQKVFQAQSKTLVEYPIDLGALSVGPLNIPVSADFKTTLDCSFDWGGNAGVVAGGIASASVTAGLKYDPTNGVTPVWSHTQSFTQVGPTWTLNGAVGAKCTLRPEFDLKFWDVAAAEIWAEPYVALHADAACNNATLTGQLSGEAYAGVSATAHAKIDVFGLYKWEKTCQLFAIDSPHAMVNATFPLPGGMNATCTPPPAAPAPVNQDAPPSSCFGDGSGPNTPPADDAGTVNPISNDDGGGVAPSGDGGSCNISPEQPPAGWTCAPSKYGDCVCDCNCGATDRDCATGQCGGCDHTTCVEGTPLGTSCTQDGQGGACIQSICAHDSYCCEFSWSASCVAHITNGDYACTAKTCP